MLTSSIADQKEDSQCLGESSCGGPQTHGNLYLSCHEAFKRGHLDCARFLISLHAHTRREDEFCEPTLTVVSAMQLTMF